MSSILGSSCWFVLSLQKNPPAVEIIDERAITLDKQALKEALKAGEAVPGAALIQGTRLVVR